MKFGKVRFKSLLAGLLVIGSVFCLEGEGEIPDAPEDMSQLDLGFYYKKDYDAAEVPIAKRREMFETGTYRGVWGCNVSFSIKVLSIESNGTGVLAEFMRILPFTWKKTGRGRFHGSFDKDLALLGEMPGTEFDCRYDPDGDRMILIVPPETSGKAEGEAEGLPLLTTDVHLKDLDKYLTAIKSSPDFALAKEEARAKQAAAKERAKEESADGEENEEK